MSDIIKTGLRLFIITAIAAVCMGITNLATKGPIEEQRIANANLAKQTVLPQADEFTEVGIMTEIAEKESAKIVEINAGKASNDIVGYTFKVITRGFGGDMEVIVGINSDNQVESIQIGVHSETPGLGTKTQDDSFMDQYKGKSADNILSVTKNSPGDSEIQAVSGATVTSDAVTNGVNLASQYYSEVLQSGGGENEAVKDN
ncbi:MAG: RnfABCDGE type electron transport complex subunit G [Clostridiales bacterium]|nr:RnfABCDGE type electron transport complex subunit G [Clostridiales bacterium]